MTQLLNAIPGALAQGLIWGVMAIGVYITYKVLDIADLTVDGSLCTGAAVCTMLLLAGPCTCLVLRLHYPPNIFSLKDFHFLFSFSFFGLFLIFS